MHYPTLITFADEILSRKDPYNHHGAHVAKLSLQIANKMQGVDVEMLDYAARLHDVGKIMIEDTLCNAPRKLTATELSRMHEHVEIGVSMLRNMNCDPRLVEAVGAHQEHYDGSGYPKKLTGKAIPLFARIITIADVWESITSDRAYRKAMPFETALLEMSRCNKWFDPMIYTHFLDVLRETPHG